MKHTVYFLGEVRYNWKLKDYAKLDLILIFN